MVLVQHQLHQNMSSLLVFFERKLSHNMATILTIDTIQKYYIEIGVGGWKNKTWMPWGQNALTL